MKLCKDCTFFRSDDGTACRNPAVMETDPVWGPKAAHPSAERKYGDRCGPDGKLWEARTKRQLFRWLHTGVHEA
ncbi:MULTISPECIES: hypothetical protein [unclassified Mesorhizobium]|uniref:hypothetical protein n=1 Tax=unclassified Mesorhizobium TaxID=325217 RepID=UPI0003CEB7BE|nr:MULTISPECIES: hypothetical protein [unclassified Mesorhizobium]ESX98724.1 hypothetical protein X755_15345 [Mesorhizobium sp. LNJC405B00]ESY41991.1 hypothetical protein X747_14365 [Mesorhizobium sp. LNJC384A00]